jgi:uncharacterized membrane protein YciS (DUF1049 family)
MSEFVMSQLIATVFYMGAGFALGFMVGKVNTRKVAQCIVKEMEKRLELENGKKGATKQ